MIIYKTARTFVLLGKIVCTSNPSEQRICCDKHNIPIPVALVHQCKLIYQFVAKVSLSVEVGIFSNWILKNFGQRSPAITLIFFKVWEIPCFFNLSPNGTPGCKCKLGFNLVGVIAVVSRISKKKERERLEGLRGFDKIISNSKSIL